MAEILNRNAALNTSFLFEIPLCREFNYFVQTCEVPDLTMSGVDTPWTNHQGAVPSNRIDFGFFNCTFIVDEDWKNWEGLFRWMQRIRTGPEHITDVMCDCTLHLPLSTKSRGRMLKFFGAFPTTISSIPLDSTQSATNELVCSLTMRYQYFDIE